MPLRKKNEPCRIQIGQLGSCAKFTNKKIYVNVFGVGVVDNLSPTEARAIAAQLLIEAKDIEDAISNK